MKKLLAILLTALIIFTGCVNNDWQTITCEIPVYEGNVFRDGEKITYGESRKIDGYQSISFKLPKGYYQTENTGDYETEKTWTNGETTIAIFGVKLVDAKEYFEYEEYAYNTNESNAKQKTRTALTCGVVKSSEYQHLVDTTLGEYVIRFTVYSNDDPEILNETIKFIQTVADSFECTEEMVLNEPKISPEDLALAEKAASFLGAIHNAGVWDSADEIGVHRFYLWYIDYIASVTTYEERLERYKHENYEIGWSYPQEEFEAFMQKYFDVSIEHLRSDEWCYHAKDGVYNLDYIGAPNLRYTARLAQELPTIDGDIMYIPMEMYFDGDFRSAEYRTLVIQKTQGGFKYLKSVFTTEKVDFLEYSMLVPKDMRVDNNTVYFYDVDYNKNIELVKLIETYPATERDSVFADAEKEYKESEYFISESEYSDDRLSWMEYTLKIPLPEESGLDMTETYSYYFVNYKDKVIKFETRPLIYGMGGSHREEIEDILKTIN